MYKDNGGRRTGIERRQFSYFEHIPERRSGKERRSGRDRRQETRTDYTSTRFMAQAQQN